MTLFTQAGIENNAVEILFSDIQWDLLLSCVVITLVSVFMMFIAFKNYIWLRIQDYSMYMTLGMRNRRFLAMLGLEYLANWIVSFAIGLLLGRGLLLCCLLYTSSVIMAILEGKKAIIIGDRDGIPGPAIAECVKTAGAEIVFSSTECFV